MQKFKIEDLWINFPFIPYAPQEKFMEEMLKSLNRGHNALLESPTGTGKTLCLLGAGLAWLDSQKKLQEKLELRLDQCPDEQDENCKHYKIYFCSRTHSQIKQAINEYQNCSYGHLRSAVLGSRKHLCINPIAKNADSNLDNKCRALRRDTKCPAPGPDIEDLPRKCNECLGDHKCQYYQNFLDMKTKGEDKVFTEGGALDQIELIKKCRKYRVCPFYMSRHIQKTADIIFLPYSYIFNPHILRGLQLKIRDAIIIIDEGHNLEKVCEENASFEVMISDLQRAWEELRRSEELVGSKDFAPDIRETDIYELKNITNKIQFLLDTRIEEGKLSYNGKVCLDLFAEAGLNESNRRRVLYNLKQIIQGCGEKEVKTEGMKKLQELIACVFYLDHTETDNHASTLEESFVLYKEKLKPEEIEKKKEPKIFFWCFDAGVIMRNLRDQGVHSFIVTSGTLSPLEPLKKSLSIDFQVTLSNEHVVEKSQVLGLCVPKGDTINGITEEFNLKYSKREERGEYIYEALGHMVYNVASVSPKGLLMFFPSKTVRESCLKRWGNVNVEDDDGRIITLYDAIYSRKAIFHEPKEAGELPMLQRNYSEKIYEKGSSGACLFGVMSGKVSEGIDFKDDLGRVVIMVGVPFPNADEPWVKLKKLHLKKKGKSDKEWYLSVAIRPVNQALGRIIRHQADYGAIIMADFRYFEDGSIIKVLPKWLKKDTKVNKRTLLHQDLEVVKFDELGGRLKNFFSQIPIKMEEIKKKTEQQQAKILKRHMDELNKEVFPETEYHVLLKKRDDERYRKTKLELEISSLHKQLKEKNDQIKLLEMDLNEREQEARKQVEQEAATQNKLKKAKKSSEQEANPQEDMDMKEPLEKQETGTQNIINENNADCDSDCDSQGESEWEAVESQASQAAM